MTRRSTTKLVKPFKESEREFRSSGKLGRTRSLDYLSSLKLNLFFDQEDQYEKEVAEEIGEPTMEECITKTQEDYGSGIARPKIDEKAHFELKGQFLKELRDNTFSGADNADANEHIEKILKIVDLFHIPEEVILFYKGLDVSTRQILDSKGVMPYMNATEAKKAIQDLADYSQKWHNGMSTKTRSTDTFDGLAAIQAELNNIGREIKKVNERVHAAQVGCESWIGPH
ncbi:hypothetical protein Tco_0594951 [Tanacetum coccineum]